ncbi:hypothetical protein EJ08DRAFT_39683 [Tothia fuscella]|uniref:Transcription initiation factor TFIID subunit 1 histone acetyltransferase domain-containing protein n=1 Tax=Tothia fuscella TaxID=1048955 RepID=A0A9P4NWS0_9PEZI|nr:hypothetical protein EJ08DRAFT_39683 [Tothia fuscella]
MASVAPPTPNQQLPHNLSPANAFKMPHAVDEWDKQEEADQKAIQRLLAAEPTDEQALFDPNRELDVGEKADDAIDFGDLSDDDLPDEEPAINGGEVNGDGEANGHAEEDDGFDGLFEEDGDGDGYDNVNGDGGDGDDDFNHLFDEQPSSDTVPDTQNENDLGHLPDAFSTPPSAQKVKDASQTLPSPETQEDLAVQPMVDYEEDDDTREQRELFESARREREERLRRGGITTDAPLPAPQTNAELLESIWPQFNREEVPRFGALFPGKRAFYLSKKPLKAPKPIEPSRPHLDPEQDQDRAFRAPATASLKRANEELNDGGILFITEEDAGPQTSDEELEMIALDEQEEVGGVSIQDLRVLCEDWDDLTAGNMSDGDVNRSLAIQVGDDMDEDDDLFGERPTKRRKTDTRDIFKSVVREDFPSFDDPEALTAKLAKHVPLDLNDPNLLIDTQPVVPQASKKVRNVGETQKEASGLMASALYKKYNFSNDQEYELLKENHAKRVRGTLGTVAVEHSNVALNLQWPFYKIKLSTKEARAFHRPSMHFTPNNKVLFEKKLGFTKLKNLKGQDVQTTFNTAKDLTLADNSTMLLMEYSEECPMMLSNFGMGNRLINYYRRKDDDDKERPKMDLGETHVLLPDDMSPFSKFGKVDPGETVPTLHNAMFRAPVFKHQPNPMDFLVIRNQTGVHGSHYYLRNVENLHVVGQEFPSVDVPGVHSRRVTHVAKQRLRMLSFRIYNKHKAMNARQPWLGNEEITSHFPGTAISQNRTKMREIMQYDKDLSSWKPKQEEPIPEGETLRNLVSPEDICLIDSMQVGHRQLTDAGHDKASIGKKDEVDENASIDEQLAPWYASKNFLAACGDNGMIALHGAGDPTGRGEGFSFVKISMKGGFRAPGESVDAQLSALAKKQQTGHSYNVEDQTKAYTATIERIWNAQQQSLSSAVEADLDTEMNGVEDGAGQTQAQSAYSGHTPRSEAATPAAFSRRGEDDSASQFSRMSGTSKGRLLKITRTAPNAYGKMEETTEFVEDETVANLYLKRRHQDELSKVKLEDYEKTGDPIKDGIAQQAIIAELERLAKNMDRRHVRENQKKMKKNTYLVDAAGGAMGKPGQTMRKCANCNRAGHIKTNKKLCPLLNGEWKDGIPPSALEGGSDPIAFASTPAPTVATPDVGAATPYSTLPAPSPAPLNESLPF